MEGPAAFTALEWQELAAAMPGGGGEADILLREKLFKELVVRAAALPENRFKSQARNGFKGTLKSCDVEVPLQVILGKKGLSERCIDAVLAMHKQAFCAAQKWVTSISVIDRECIDMNQFHAFVIHIDTYFSLWKFVLQIVPPESTDMLIDVQAFQGLMETLTDPTQDLLGIPWTSVSKFDSWKENPQAGFDELADSDGYLHFEDLADTCIFHVVDTLLNYDDNMPCCRKRAFLLLQALNNMPSLPNAVPGPMSSRNDGARQQDGAPADSKRPLTSQWSTSNREGFPLHSVREPQGHYAPSTRPTQRDLGWHVFPVEMPKLYAKT